MNRRLRVRQNGEDQIEKIKDQLKHKDQEERQYRMKTNDQAKDWNHGNYKDQRKYSDQVKEEH